MNRLTLRACGENRLTITSIDGVVREFAPVDDDTSERARLSHVVDSGGRSYRFNYDGLNRLRAIWAPHETEGEIRQVRFSFDGDDLVEVTDALGHAHKVVYKQHLLVKETDRAGFSLFFQYNGNNHHAKCGIVTRAVCCAK